VHVRLTTAGVRIRESSSVLDPARVEALLARLTATECHDALKGLALLASAAQQSIAERPNRSAEEAP